MMNKSAPFAGLKALQYATIFLAFLFSIALVIAAGIEVYWTFVGIFELNIVTAIQEGLFVLILLEMFYVVRSFIKYGSVNTALIISVGIVAIVKEVIFKLGSLDLETAIGYSVLFISFSIGFLIENSAHRRTILQGNKPRSIRDFTEQAQEAEYQAEEVVKS